MHISGKIFTWLIVLLAVGALLLTVKMLNVRNTWSKAVLTENEKIEQNRLRILDLERQITDLERQYTSQMQVMGKYWSNVDADLAADPYVATLKNLGRDHGLGRPAAGGAADTAAEPRVYLFGVVDDRTSVYAGDLAITQIAPGSTGLQSGWPLPQELRPATWRVRIGIPEKQRGRISDLQNQIVATQTAFQDSQRNLALAQQNAQEAADIVARRQAELEGDPAQPQAPGLIARVAQADAERNQELAELARLRREVQQTYARREELVQRLAQ